VRLPPLGQLLERIRIAVVGGLSVEGFGAWKVGKPGRRVRRGLGTADDAEAARLVDELNEILRTPSMWEPAASRCDGQVRLSCG
jgi:hypothetical protein